MLTYWNKFKEVPANAKKTIGGGRLKGMTDINPMWRIKVLTETFGMCGLGWKYVVTSKRLEPGANNEVAAFVDIELYVNDPSRGWSEAIPGTGGSMFVANETKGLYTSDEAYKMALTDALSVACKALGIGADVYWNDTTKYTKATDPEPPKPPKEPETALPKLTAEQRNKFAALCPHEDDKARLKEALTNLGYVKLSDVPQKDYNRLMDTFTGIGLPFELGKI